MRLGYLGKGNRAVKCIRALFDAGHDIPFVIAHSNEKKPFLLEEISKEHGVTFLAPDKINAPETIATIASYACEYIVMAGYTQILKKSVLTSTDKGVINLHGGRLPEYRGGSPINWQIINGETYGECVIHLVDEGIDTGPILARQSYPIGPDDTAGIITARTLKIFPELLIRTLSGLESGKLIPIPQASNEGMYYRKRHPSDGEINWHNMSALEVHNFVRALNGPGLPGAFTLIGNTKVGILKSRMIEKQYTGTPGVVRSVDPEGAIVFAKDRGLLVTDVRRWPNITDCIDPSELLTVQRLG